MKLFKLFRYLQPFWKKEVFVLVLSLSAMALSLVNPYLAKIIIDQAYVKKDLNLFIVLVIIGGAVFLLNSAISGILNYFSNYIRLKVNYNIHLKVFEKLQLLPYAFFQNSSTGENLYKINYDIEQVACLITDTLPQAITTFPKFIIIYAIIFSLNWKIAVYALVIAPFLFILPYFVTKRMKEASRVLIEASQDVFKRLQEVLSHIQLTKAFGKEEYEIRTFKEGLLRRANCNLKRTKLGAKGSFANSLINRLILGLITFYGGYQLIKGRLTLGDLSAITIYFGQLSGLQSSFGQLFQQVSLGLVSRDRLKTILDTPSQAVIESADAKEIIFSKGDIEFRNATFGYQPEKMILEDLSFFIRGGAHIALVGPSGCGKTTIINLLLRLYNLHDGQILIDGKGIMEVRSRSFYEQIGVVLQEPYLWNDTIESNIRYGKEKASLGEVQDAARIACIDDFINLLPQKYNSLIGENACKISEGQKQRIAIARALIKRPKILILDEALSSVDAQTEGAIIDNIRDSLKGVTLIVVSHRLTAISRMNAVYFLESAGKMEIGRHEELLERNTQYQRYLAVQLQR